MSISVTMSAGMRLAAVCLWVAAGPRARSLAADTGVVAMTDHGVQSNAPTGAGTADDRARTQIAAGQAATNHAAARAAFEAVFDIPGVSPYWRAQAQMQIANAWRQEGWRSADRDACWAQARTACAKVLDIPGVPSAMQLEAVRALAFNLQTFQSPAVHQETVAGLDGLLVRTNLPAEVTAGLRVALGKCQYLNRRFPDAESALAPVAVAAGALPRDAAEAELLRGLSAYRAGDDARAASHLRQVLTLPGADDAMRHDALLRLRLRKLMPDPEAWLAVLFVGASQTQVGKVPTMVELLAASAPAGTPRIIADGYLRGGTGLHKFWEEGDGPGTLRERIREEPWDRVVFETHPYLFGADVFRTYSAKAAALTRASGATPVIFETPPFLRHDCPAVFEQAHADTLALAAELDAPVAPAALAFLRFWGPAPTLDQRKVLYHPDAVHPSPQGAYLIACCLYAALTGRSPLGLASRMPHLAPPGISPDEARVLQEVAWQAISETQAALAARKAAGGGPRSNPASSPQPPPPGAP